MGSLAGLLANLRTIYMMIVLVKEAFSVIKKISRDADLAKAKSDGYQEGLQAAYGQKLNPKQDNGPLGNPGPGEGFGGPSGG